MYEAGVLSLICCNDDPIDCNVEFNDVMILISWNAVKIVLCDWVLSLSITIGGVPTVVV